MVPLLGPEVVYEKNPTFKITQHFTVCTMYGAFNFEILFVSKNGIIKFFL